jgi:hypothetical protein
MADKTFYDQPLPDEYKGIPEDTIIGIENYMRYGLPPGSFVYLLLVNAGWLDVMNRASDKDALVIDKIAKFVYSLPSDVRGSVEQVEAYLSKREFHKEWTV